MASQRVLALSAVLALLTLCPAGCAKPPPRLVPVSGKVMYRGEPVRGMKVTFVPDLAKGNRQGQDGRGTTGDDGSFTLHTYPDGAGAMPGHYKVTVLYYTRSEGVPRKYTKFYLTPLTVEVPEAGVTDLVLTVRD